MLSRLLKRSNDAVPAFTKRRFFTSEEKAFYGRLRRALPKCYIFPDIELNKLMVPTSTDGRSKRGEHDVLAGRKVDFAVFDARLNLLCVIDLTPPEGASAASLQNAAYLASAGIKLFRWDAEGLPSTDQMLRALAEFSAVPVPRQEGDPVTQAGDAGPVTVAAPPKSEILFQPRPRNLTLQDIDALAPKFALKTGFPHVWSRICLFSQEPKQLDRYLVSLSVQDRGAKRAGFTPEAVSEMARILEENARFLQPEPVNARSNWNDVFAHR